LAFIFAFYKGFKTILFAFSCIVILYILNLFRIYVLNVVVVNHYEYTKPAHDYFFPAIIYGGVVLLWLIWINKFVLKEELMKAKSNQLLKMKFLNWIFVVIGVLGLISVRFLENSLFYDPFLEFFKGNYKVELAPDFILWKLILSHFFFLLNLFFSAIVVHFMFLNKKWTLQAVLLMAVAFIFFPIYLWCIYSKMEIGYLFTFSVRRFVIQPIILLLIIPIFYYRKSWKKLGIIS
jgi:exosortase F-associated protein